MRLAKVLSLITVWTLAIALIELTALSVALKMAAFGVVIYVYSGVERIIFERA